MEKAKNEKLKWDTPMLVKLGGAGSFAAGRELPNECNNGSATDQCCDGAIADTHCL